MDDELPNAADAVQAVEQVMRLSSYIKPMLAGLGPEVQGALLANLVSLWLAGHRPDLREDTLARWLETMKDLIAPSEDEIFGGTHRPPGWGKN